MNTFKTLMTAAALAVTLPSFAADTLTDTVRTCAACHSETAVANNPNWPSLFGQNAPYLAIQLRAFRDGTRVALEMQPFVAGLSDQKIAELAQYYSEQSVRAKVSSKVDQTTAGNQDLVADGRNLAGYCSACHGQDGNPVELMWPKLGGQNANYTYKQLVNFKNGNRVHPFMQSAVASFSEAQLAALAAYYSQLVP